MTAVVVGVVESDVDEDYSTRLPKKKKHWKRGTARLPKLLLRLH